MNDIRYSVMVLPRRKDGAILLQSFTELQGTMYDGFGSFYDETEEPLEKAKSVLEQHSLQGSLTEVAKLQFIIHKPSGTVDLRTVIYFAKAEDSLLLQNTMAWHETSVLPYQHMHAATGKWLPLLLEGNIPLRAAIEIDQPAHHTKGVVTAFTVY